MLPIRTLPIRMIFFKPSAQSQLEFVFNADLLSFCPPLLRSAHGLQAAELKYSSVAPYAAVHNRIGIQKHI